MTAHSDRLRLLGTAAALTVGILVIANAAADIVMERRPGEDGYLGFLGDFGSIVGNLILTGLPFFVLAMRANRRMEMWITAVGLSGLSWVYAVWQLRKDYLADFEGGANIGLGIIMMAAPFAILLVLKFVSFGLKRREGRTAV